MSGSVCFGVYFCVSPGQLLVPVIAVLHLLARCCSCMASVLEAGLQTAWQSLKCSDGSAFKQLPCLFLCSHNRHHTCTGFFLLLLFFFSLALLFSVLLFLFLLFFLSLAEGHVVHRGASEARHRVLWGELTSSLLPVHGHRLLQG